MCGPKAKNTLEKCETRKSKRRKTRKSEKQSERTEIKQDFRTEMGDEVLGGGSLWSALLQFWNYPPALVPVPA